MSHLEEHQMLLNIFPVFPCAVATTAEVPMQHCITLVTRSSDTPYFAFFIYIWSGSGQPLKVRSWT